MKTEIFDIKNELIQSKTILDIGDVVFLEVVPLVTNAMFACYPALETPTLMEFRTELESRIDGWYVWTKHTPYRGLLRQIAVSLIVHEYRRILESMGFTCIVK